MKKKLFTLLTLLVICVTGAWGAITPKTITNTGGEVYMVTPETLYEYYNSGNGWVTNASGGAITSNSYYSSKSGTNNTNYINPETEESGTKGQASGITLKTADNRSVRFYFTGAIKATAFIAATGSSRTATITVYKVSDDTKVGSTTGTNYTASGPYEKLEVTGLTATESYYAKVTATNDLCLYAMKFFAGVTTPSLTGAWSAASGTIFKDDAVPTPTFTVSASNSAALTGSEYSVAYSVKEGSNDGLITITGEGAGFTLNNDATGTATLVATLTSANESNYTTPTTNTYEYVYTVNAKVPTYTLNKDDHDISLRSTPVHRAADTNETATVTMEAGFLTGTSGTVTFVGDAVDGLSVSPAVFTITDGSVAETEFTITYNSASGTSGTATLRFSDGTNSKDLLIDYASVVAHTWATVSGATTWDWSKLTGSDVQLTDETTPKKTDEFLLGDMDGEVLTQNVGYTPATFNADAIKMIAQYAVRNKSYAQATQVKFKTSVPGTVKVNYSNTGGSRPYRHIEVNGVLSAEGSASTTAIDTEEIPVTAGEVTIKVYIPDASSPQAGNDDVVGYTMARINKVIFTPLDGTTDVDVVKVTSVNYATYVTTAAIDFTKTAEVQAYKVTSTTDAIEYEEVEAAPAGTPLLIKATSSSYVLKAADSTPADVTGNLLQASIGSTVGDGSTIYVLGNNGGTAVWGKLKNGKTLSAGKAYLVITGGGAKEFYDIIIGGDGETTAIDHVSTPRFNSDAAIYNLSGQKVTESYKGIVIVNGKKYMNK